MTVHAVAAAGVLHIGSRDHWAALAAIALVASVLIWLLRRFRRTSLGPRLASAVCGLLAGVLIAGAVLAQLQEVAQGTWSVRESLPLHLCDIGVIVTGLALVGAARPAATTAAPLPLRQRLYELAYFWGLGGTLQAVVTPDIAEGFPSPACIRYFSLHGGIVVGVLVMTVGLGLRPLPGAFRRVWLATLALALAMLPVNWLLGANYMYLCGPPANPTLYDVFGPWPWALLTLVAVGTLIFMLCYAPFWLLDRCRATQTPGTALPDAAPRPPQT